MEWKIEVKFIGDYEFNFSPNEKEQLLDSEYRFVLAIEQIYNETKIMPVIEDWIEPLYREDYLLDMGKIVGRDFYPLKRVIRFEIE